MALIKKFYFTSALHSLQSRSVRSWLTITGIVISVAVILILLTLSAGLQNAVLGLFEQFGANRIYIAGAGASTGQLGSVPLLESDYRALQQSPYFSIVIPYLIRNAQEITYRNENKYLPVTGIGVADAAKVDQVYGFSKDAVQGRFFTNREQGVAFVGYNIAYNKDIFSKPLGVHNTIYINGKPFKIVGVYKEVGDSADDNSVFIPLPDAQALFNVTNEYTAFEGVVKQGATIEQARAWAEKTLKKKKGGTDEFTILTPDAIIKQFKTIIGLVQDILLAIASISLIVGALGIANNMFTTVLERESEIGIMKSTGATNTDVLLIFIIESGMVGLIGGIIGIIIGIGASYLIGFIAAAAGFKLLTITINIFHILFVMAFAFIIGALSGLLPSYNASRKTIVETLRSF